MADTTTQVEQLYVAYFSRAADPAGLQYWSGVLNSAADGIQQISANFAASAEYKAAYSGKTNDQIVNTVYLNLFGRAAETAGLNYWSDLLNKKLITIDNVVTQIAAGAQGNDSVAYSGKVAVSKVITAHIDTQAEISAYSGAAANKIVIDYVAEVKDLASAASHVDPGAVDAMILTLTGGTTASAPVELVGSAPVYHDGMA